MGMWEQLPNGANRHRLVWEIPVLCPLPIQDKLLLDVGSFKVIILGNVLELGFNSWEEGKKKPHEVFNLIYSHGIPSFNGTSWALCPHGNQDFIPGHGSEGLLLPFSYLFTSLWKHLVLLKQEFRQLCSFG